MEVEIKKQLLEACESFVQEKINRIERAIADLEDSLKLETKCSMGDKYETGRAMLHLEFEKLSIQHEQYQKLKKTVRMIDPMISCQKSGFGAVVETQQTIYFIAIPAGEITLDKGKFYAVGAGAPISQALGGKIKGDEINFNGKRITVKKVY